MPSYASIEYITIGVEKPWKVSLAGASESFPSASRALDKLPAQFLPTPHQLEAIGNMKLTPGKVVIIASTD